MNRIKELRSEAGMLQADLAKVLKVRQNTVSNWETGRHEPDQDALCAMSKIFNVSIDYILGNTDTKKAPTSEEMDALTPKQKDIIHLMDQMTPEQQDELLRQAQYQLWLKQQDKSDS